MAVILAFWQFSVEILFNKTQKWNFHFKKKSLNFYLFYFNYKESSLNLFTRSRRRGCWRYVVKRGGEPGENHRTWTGDHYPATCLDPDSNPDRRGDKRVRYSPRYQAPEINFHLITIYPNTFYLLSGGHVEFKQPFLF